MKELIFLTLLMGACSETATTPAPLDAGLILDASGQTRHSASGPASVARISLLDADLPDLSGDAGAYENLSTTTIDRAKLPPKEECSPEVPLRSHGTIAVDVWGSSPLGRYT
jgi:hypothetical protein